MGLGEVYIIGFLVTQALMPFGEWRKGTPWSEAWWWFMVWPIGFMWPLCLLGIVADIIDGPYRPKHRYDYW